MHIISSSYLLVNQSELNFLRCASCDVQSYIQCDFPVSRDAWHNWSKHWPSAHKAAPDTVLGQASGPSTLRWPCFGPLAGGRCPKTVSGCDRSTVFLCPYCSHWPTAAAVRGIETAAGAAAAVAAFGETFIGCGLRAFDGVVGALDHRG